MTKRQHRPDTPAVKALKARVHAARCLLPADVRWFLLQYEPDTAPVEVIEGPPCMMIVRSAMPVSRAARALFGRLAPAGMDLHFVRGRHA